jgi:2-polyprenyl-3-methyl-5-hydroxy-6-metoxy-1,4-benzoquinol methylase
MSRPLSPKFPAQPDDGSVLMGPRFSYDGQATLDLNSLQRATKAAVDAKVANGTYEFETVSCAVCGAQAFEYLATKDRYGLYLPVAVCRPCGLVQTNPRMSQKAYTEFYNQEYRKLYLGSDAPTMEFFERRRHKGAAIFRYLVAHGAFRRPVSESSVLEVGCGSGGVLQYFKEMGCRVQGIDIGSEYVQFGRDKFGLNLSVATTAEAALTPPYDVIIYSHVLEHILEPTSELNLARRLLTDAGAIYVEVPGIKNLRHSYEMDFLKYLQNAHVYHFSLATLQELMRVSGLELLAGNEVIQSAFRKREGALPAVPRVSDYEPVLHSLRSAELRRRILPRLSTRKEIRRLALALLRRTGLYSVTRALYRRFRNRPPREG